MANDDRAGRALPSSGSVPDLSVSSVGSAVVVLVTGELDLLTAPQLLAVIDRHQHEPAVELVIVDLSQVEFLGSAGLGVLAEIATRAIPPAQPVTAPVGGGRRRVPVRLVAPPSHRPVVRPWAAMNLQQIVPLHPTVLNALEAR